MSLDTFEPVFGEWKLGRQIGSGTDGKVYRLSHIQPQDEKSVVKIIRLNHERIAATNTADKHFRSYSKDEYCRAFIKNITDNIDLVTSSDAGEFFVKYKEWEIRPGPDDMSTMLLIRLEQLMPLSDFMNDFSFTEAEVLRLAVCLCQSLDKCRDFGFIYPNLKPENVLFDVLGRCKLGDFGTFCCVAPRKNTIAYKRTQQYMAPEFYTDGSINETCDTYSLGLLMYALVNKCRLPFLKPYPADITMNDSAEAMRRRINGEAIEPPAYAGEELTAVILKAVSFDSKDRYRTPRHMLNDLKKLLNGEPATFGSDMPQGREEYIPIPTVPDEDDDILAQYEQEYIRLQRANPDPPPARKRRTARQDLSNVVTYNYNDKSADAFGRVPKKLLVAIIAAVTVLALSLIALGVKYGMDGLTACMYNFSGCEAAGAQSLGDADLIIQQIFYIFT